jgi:hypothetical protein
MDRGFMDSMDSMDSYFKFTTAITMHLLAAPPNICRNGKITLAPTGKKLSILSILSIKPLFMRFLRMDSLHLYGQLTIHTPVQAVKRRVLLTKRKALACLIEAAWNRRADR